MKNRFNFILILAIALVFTACQKDEATPVAVPAFSRTQTLTVNFSATKPFAFFWFQRQCLGS